MKKIDCFYCHGKCGCHKKGANSLLACGCPFNGDLTSKIKVGGNLRIVQCPIHGMDSTNRCPDCRADDLYLLEDVIPHGLSLPKKEFAKQLDAHLKFYKIDALTFYRDNKIND